MSKFSNLFLVTNLGCEMLYILHQRLNAQKISKYKGIQVLTDIAEVLLNETLLHELSSAKILANHEYIQTLLQDIASVSILRLDPFSMKKLWELMTMVFKWQLTLVDEKNILNLTTRHLHGVSILPQLSRSVQVQTQIARMHEFFDKIAKETSVEDLIRARNVILNWLRDFRTNVSLLLRLGFQRNDGSFVLTNLDEKYVNTLGDNIYLPDYESQVSGGMKYENNPSSTQESGELNFTINFIGSELMNKDRKKIKFNFLENSNYESIEVPGSSISYSQSQPVPVDNTHKLENNTNDGENSIDSQSTLSSVHDDLIKMLDLEE